MSEIFQGNDLLIIDVIPLVEEVMWSLTEMQISPAKSACSLPIGSVYLGVHLSGEINPELSELQKAMVDSKIQHMDKRFSVLQKNTMLWLQCIEFQDFATGTISFKVCNFQKN